MADYSGYDYKSDNINEEPVYPKGTLDTKLGSVYGSIDIEPISYGDITPISTRENYLMRWKREIKDLTTFSKSFVLPLMLIPLIASAGKGLADIIKKKQKAKKK